MITLHSSSSKAQFHPFGASILSWTVSDKNGIERDILAGWENDPPENPDHDPYFGATCGRVANRIAKGQFTLNGKKYQLSCNNGGNHLHGGSDGLSFKLWTVESKSDHSVTFVQTSKDGHDGYPGDIQVRSTYTLNENSIVSTLEIINASTQDTIANPTIHPYFNLSGFTEDTILNHKLRVYGKEYVETDNELLPTGKIEPIKGTPLDFSDFKVLGDRIDEYRQFNHKGYDHYIMTKSMPDDSMKKVCSLLCESTGLTLDVSATSYGFQIYSANYFNNIPSKKVHQQAGMSHYMENAALAIECHAPPDAINHEQWRAQVILNPGKTFKNICEYKISVN